MNKKFQEKSLGQFLNAKELLGEPRVWDDINLHTFYEIFINKKELYVRGDVLASNPEKIAISTKVISKTKRVQTTEWCVKWREQKSLYCETVEKIVLSILGGKPWIINNYFLYTTKGVDLVVETIFQKIPKIDF